MSIVGTGTDMAIFQSHDAKTDGIRLSNATSRHCSLFWTGDIDLHDSTLNSARNRQFETGRPIVDLIR